MPDEIDFVPIVADELKSHCKEWGYDWIEKLKADNSIKNFRKLFFKVTHLYYVFFEDDCYNVTFDKTEDVAYIKRCGADFDKRGIDAKIGIAELLKELCGGSGECKD